MIRRSSLILLVVFLLLLAGTIFWQKYKTDQEAKTTQTPAANLFFGVQSQDIVRLEVIQPTGKAVVLDLATPDVWVMEGITAEETNSFKVKSVVDQLASLSVLSPLEQSPAADIVGLSQPAYIIRVKLSDGSQKTAYIGKATPTGSGYYARLEDGNMVILNKFSVDSIVEILTNPPIMPTPLPTPTPTTAPETSGEEQPTNTPAP